MGQSIRAVIEKGQQAINKYKSEGEEIPSDWYEHLNKLIYEYKIDTVREELDEINQNYPIGLFDWLKDNERSLYKEHFLIEMKLNDLITDNTSDFREFDVTVNLLKKWFAEAILLYQDRKNESKFI